MKSAIYNSTVKPASKTKHRARLGFGFLGSNPLAGRQKVENLSGFFAFYGADCQLTKQCSKLRRLSRKVVRLLATRRENLHAVSQEQGKRGDGA